eukprot:CAMPEP_0115224526 /NCGR_PEP_ID=MMETSP0270-20121206/29618_1 /TAXON_ID=71861 /ORGANISM="Scrippsiella trochoidea, Strain CCMP3099" /LENGTH=447 /DNA_ID=CAMNT_0002638835 /DNA_START=37 /DNA_END=1380 /DNA_ORIENTATION=-
MATRRPLQLLWRRAPHGSRCFPASPGMHQTPIVDLLWTKRKKAQEELATKATTAAASSEGKVRTLSPKAPGESAQSVTYEFSKPENAWLVDKYRNPWGHVRPGRLFEDLDALAGTIAFEHCKSSNPNDSFLHIVTASVDRIKYNHRPNLKDDLVLSGKVTWVGRSSMEIQMRAQASWTHEPFMESLFTFVARDPDTGRAAQINPLVVSGDEQTALFNLGRQRDAVRKEQRKQAKSSAVGRALDEEGMQTAQALMDQAQPLLTMPSLANPNDVFLSETQMQNTFLTMPQQRNTAGRIFGGFLMRRAYELARSTAHLFGGRRPVFHELDEVTFKAPVSVGDMVKFEACVLYTSEKMDPAGRATIHTEVVAHVLKPETRQTLLSNTFNFTFGLTKNIDGSGGSVLGTDIELRRVLPATSAEAYRIVERYEADARQVAEDANINSMREPNL